MGTISPAFPSSFSRITNAEMTKPRDVATREAIGTTDATNTDPMASEGTQ